MKVAEMLWNNKYSIKDLWGHGQDFVDKFNSIWPEKVWIEGYSVRGRFQGDQDVINKLWQEAAQAGIILGPSWFYCFNHEEYQYRVLTFLKEILLNIKAGNVTLWGKKPKSPFSSKSRS